MPAETKEEEPVKEQKETPTETKVPANERNKPVRILVNIRMTNGLNMTQGNLSYRELQSHNTPLA